MLIFDPIPHFPPGGVQVQQIQTPQTIGDPHILHLGLPKGPQNGPKRVKLTSFQN